MIDLEALGDRAHQGLVGPAVSLHHPPGPVTESPMPALPSCADPEPATARFKFADINLHPEAVAR